MSVLVKERILGLNLTTNIYHFIKIDYSKLFFNIICFNVDKTSKVFLTSLFSNPLILINLLQSKNQTNGNIKVLLQALKIKF